MKKLISILLSCCFLCTILASCDDNSSSDKSSQESTVSDSNDKSSDGSLQSGTGDSAVTEPMSTANTDIDPDRLNKDYDSLEKEASALFEKYFDGIKKDDYKTFSKVFPDFYLDALEEEGKDYNQTNEEFIKSINEDNKTKYGDDYYAFAEITAILQLTDESLVTINDSIKETFGKKVNVEDGYSVYITQTTRGSITKDSADIDYLMLVIDGKYYLYDEYFTNMQEQ